MPVKKNHLLITIIVLVVVAGFVIWYWQQRKGKVPESAPLQSVTSGEATTTLGGQIFEKTQNPLKGQVPDANPFKEQKNPFDTIYQNPFE